MFCDQCGAAFHGGSRVCPNCGYENLRKKVQKAEDLATEALETARSAEGDRS